MSTKSVKSAKSAKRATSLCLLDDDKWEFADVHWNARTNGVCLEDNSVLIVHMQHDNLAIMSTHPPEAMFDNTPLCRFKLPPPLNAFVYPLPTYLVRLCSMPPAVRDVSIADLYTLRVVPKGGYDASIAVYDLPVTCMEVQEEASEGEMEEYESDMTECHEDATDEEIEDDEDDGFLE